MRMKTNEISGAIVDTVIHIHCELGPGLLDSVYHRILVYELEKRGLLVNFGAALAKDGIHRIVNRFQES